MRKYLEAGKIVTIHGIKGELKLYPWSDSAESLTGLKKVWLDSKGTKGVNIERIRAQNNMILMKLEGIDSVEAARSMIDRVVYLDRDDLELEDGQFFVDDMKGLSVMSADDGSLIGIISDVYSTGVQTIIEIKLDGNGEKRLVPFVPQFFVSTDIEAGQTVLKPIDGLLSD